MKSLIFIGLNVADAYLTKMALAMGGTELNPMGLLWTKMVIKGLVALAIVVGLYFWGKEKLLLPLGLGMFGICCWNLASCFTAEVFSHAPLWPQYLMDML
jgi:hypothetical protein